MDREKGKELIDNALTKLQAALEEGGSATLKTYLSVMAKFHRYSFGNCLLIAAQRPDATDVAGFRAWNRFGRHVRKGEKGILILAPMVGKKRIRDDKGDEHETSTLFGFRSAYVFDRVQTEGEPLPDFATVKGDPAEYTARMRALITGSGITLDYDASIAPANGVSCGGAIRVLPGLSPAEEFSVLVHEYAHEQLHRSTERKRPDSRTVRETEAEAVAFVVSEAIGLDTNSASSDYILTYHGDKAVLAESLSAIQATAARIIRAITGASDDAPAAEHHERQGNHSSRSILRGRGSQQRPSERLRSNGL